MYLAWRSPVTVQLFGTPVITWRGVPIVPCDKLEMKSRYSSDKWFGTTSILLLRVGEADQGVVGLHQAGIPGEISPSLSARLMGLDSLGVASYLLTLYFSCAVLTDDAVGVLENVEVGYYHDYDHRPTRLSNLGIVIQPQGVATMESWSPEEIAQLATRIYNEKPDAPSTEVVPPPTPHALPSVPLPLPSPISLEPLRHRDSNAKEVTSEALLQSPLQMPSFQALKLAAASRNHPPYAPPTYAEPFVSMKPTVELSPTSLPTSTPSHWSRDRETDGLRSFIQRVRQPFTHDDLPKRASSGPQKFNPAKGDTFASRSLDIETIRRDFPILQQEVHGYPLAWMDNAATTQKPQQVIDAVSRFYESINSNIHRGAHTLAARATDAYENARRRIQVFLGASNPMRSSSSVEQPRGSILLRRLSVESSFNQAMRSFCRLSNTMRISFLGKWWLNRTKP